MPKTDLVLLHAPSVYDFRERSIMFGPVSDMVPSTPIFEMYPLGLTTIAEYLERHGYRVRIVNLAGLMLRDPKFDVEAYLRTIDPVVFGLDLHWMPHAHGSIEVAKIVKRVHPDTPVLFGGLSSSVFHEELIRYDCVDFVARGDSTEEPLRRLMQVVKGGGDFSEVPNLTWKDKSGAVIVNPLSWVPDNINDTSLDYAYSMKSVIRHRDLNGSVPFKQWLDYPVCASLTSHGCTHNCVTCGGSAQAFKKHFGRDKIAFRDPELLVRDIAHVQKYISGPVFVLNDFLQAGRAYTEEFIRGLKSIDMKNAIGFEFFGPPKDGLYDLLQENLKDWSVEISVESHDDGVRAAFGKKHYTMDQIEHTIKDALDHGCSRFDLYFMTGIPTQTADSVHETVDYVRHLYEVMGNDVRLECFISPMAPFLDPGSMVFDDPDKYGYKLRARTLEEHRERIVMPSWKYIMNYESDAMTPDELVNSTYEAAMGINRIKGEIGIITPDVAAATEGRIVGAQAAMKRIDDIMEGPAHSRDAALEALREEAQHLSESTVCEKTELNWPSAVGPKQVAAVAGLFVRENLSNLRSHLKGELAPAASDAAGLSRAVASINESGA